MARRLVISCWTLALCLGGGAFAYLWIDGDLRSNSVLLQRAASEFSSRRFDKSLAYSLHVLSRAPNNVEALILAGDSMASLGRYEEAISYYTRVADDGTQRGGAVLGRAADLMMQLGRVGDAKRLLQQALERAPDDVYLRRQLIFILNVTGSRWEAKPHLAKLLKQGIATREELILLGHLSADFQLPDELERFREAAPNDPLPLVGLARIARREQNMKQAKSLLWKAVELDKSQIEAQAQLGLSVSQSSPEEFDRWVQQLPSQSDIHPDVWVARGKWFNDHGELPIAARCFWEAVRRDPNHRLANYSLSQLLMNMGDSSSAEPFAIRAKQLLQLELLLEEAARDIEGTDRLREVAELLEALGRIREAVAWQRERLSEPSDDFDAAQSIARLETQLRPSSPLVMDGAVARLTLDASSYPLPNRGELVATTTVPSTKDTVCRVEFLDQASSAKLKFTYFNGADPRREGLRTLEVTGGGAGVLDYDLDGWPDLYLSQGCHWPFDPDQHTHLDGIFRNRGDGTFEDSTFPASLRENRFSQGVSIGDFNDDGFPDVYVANVGANCLIRNNGDGTFVDVSSGCGIVDKSWTTSCLMADLNGDAWPDLYDVNYLQGEDVFSRICQLPGERPRTCPPRKFQAATDKFYLNLANGTFADCTQEAGLLAPDGTGLGVVAADFDQSQRLSLFVANDGNANFFFANVTPFPGATPRFAERGVECGLAFDADGRSQASMGIAVGDTDGDNRLDLFVTNYYQETNTLYTAGSEGFFNDTTTTTGLAQSSFHWLGFGAQFLDGELDGKLDLIVTNGHVDDYSYRGIPFRMPPQYFQNVGQGVFREASAESLGPFFCQDHLGRGMATLDWNRDGKEDCLIVHLDEPVALLTNKTPIAGHFLALRLVGVNSNRDGLGASVQLHIGTTAIVRQLIAGGGYLSSNERRLVVGLGDHEVIDEIQVTWPSGVIQKVFPVGVDCELVLIESGTTYRCGRDERISF